MSNSPSANPGKEPIILDDFPSGTHLSAIIRALISTAIREKAPVQCTINHVTLRIEDHTKIPTEKELEDYYVSQLNSPETLAAREAEEIQTAEKAKKLFEALKSLNFKDPAEVLAWLKLYITQSLWFYIVEKSEEIAAIFEKNGYETYSHGKERNPKHLRAEDRETTAKKIVYRIITKEGVPAGEKPLTEIEAWEKKFGTVETHVQTIRNQIENIGI